MLDESSSSKIYHVPVAPVYARRARKKDEMRGWEGNMIETYTYLMNCLVGQPRAVQKEWKECVEDFATLQNGSFDVSIHTIYNNKS